MTTAWSSWRALTSSRPFGPGRAREAKEAATRASLSDRQLGPDRYHLRQLLTDLGVIYVAQREL
jgi:hypothetical protein